MAPFPITVLLFAPARLTAVPVPISVLLLPPIIDFLVVPSLPVPAFEPIKTLYPPFVIAPPELYPTTVF